jgi:hypothetical protein
MIYGHTPTEKLAPDPSTINTQRHYIGGTTIYKVAEDFKLNSYEFDIIKRILRCRHKGNWLQDLEKTKDTIDLYIKEQQENFGNSNNY